MYKIDWNKYLSEKRLRDSSKPDAADPNEPLFDKRNAFESDFGRVTFSSALRRMHDKTQVIPLTSGDSVHTRLTHSIEVMNIAHSLGINYCRNEEFKINYGDKSVELEAKLCAILKTAAIIHDIGNPPFGHFGEVVIQQYFRKLFNNNDQQIRKFDLTDQQKLDFTQFDGNAQGLRNVTKLSYRGDLYGLNLTCGTLGAYLKYPNTQAKKKDDYIGIKKHGVFTSESETLANIAKECSLIIGEEKFKRHPLSFLVEAADSICYLVMDIEDGLLLNWISLEEMLSFMKQHCKWNEGHEPNIYSELLNISNNDGWNDNDKYIRSRVALIDYLVNLANKNFIDNLKKIDLGEYNYELIEDDENKVADALKQYSRHKILSRKDVESVELTGHSVIQGLLDILISHMYNTDREYYNRAKSILSKSALKTAWHECLYLSEKYVKYTTETISESDITKLTDYAKLRLIVDYISNMTDKFAVKMYQQLSGQRL